jgi:hypothetical protein
VAKHRKKSARVSRFRWTARGASHARGALLALKALRSMT